MSDDMSKAFRAGWMAREAAISIMQPTNAREEFYGTARRVKASVRPVRYHASIYTRWKKSKATQSEGAR